MSLARSLYFCLIIILASQFLLACTRLSNAQYISDASKLGLQRQMIQAGVFPLIYYNRPHDTQADTLHVYIGGDGVPWQDYIFISEDPGPYNSLVLQLMQQDKHPSIYLGRPCYQGLARQPPCQPEHWTSARFSDEVVNSMSLALKKILHQYPYKKLALIGYSGGGALAVLLAHELPQTQLVVTIAGNLDTDAWVQYHHYSALTSSINPAHKKALPSAIRQIHLQGDRDDNIPPWVTASYMSKQDDVTILSYADADHTCCWLSYWPQLLSILP